MKNTTDISNIKLYLDCFLLAITCFLTRPTITWAAELLEGSSRGNSSDPAKIVSDDTPSNLDQHVYLPRLKAPQKPLDPPATTPPTQGEVIPGLKGEAQSRGDEYETALACPTPCNQFNQRYPGTPTSYDPETCPYWSKRG
jgi:hypothetical protein